MRIRTVKPDYFKDEHLAELSPLTRILFAGLWGLADGEGRLEDRPKFIKAEVLPYDRCDIEKMLNTLDSTKGGSGKTLIIRYKTGQGSIIQIANFKEHQRITGKEAETASKYPPPTSEQLEKHWGNIGETANVQEGKGREGKGRERKGTIVAEKSAISGVISKSQNKPPLEAELKDLKALTPLQKIVTAWKELEGVAMDDKAWDRLNWSRCSRTGNEMLRAMNGDYKVVIDCMESVRKELIEKNLSYTIETVKKWAYKWMEENGKLTNSRE